MKTEIFIEKIEQKYCWHCVHYKKPVFPRKRNKKFEVVCEENARLNSMPYHKDILLNFIDRKSMTCSNFRREFKQAKK